MHSIEVGNVADATTARMIETVVANCTAINAKDISVVLILAGFRAFEVGMRIDAVIAGARAIRARQTVERAAP